jgi:hypothetical protein
MFGVTGFVSILPVDNDKRSSVFSRYYHVRRVAWTADLLVSLLPPASPISDRLVQWLAWSHDLNRWPFAHNSEKGLFDQGLDIARYLTVMNVVAPPEGASQLKKIINKDASSLCDEGKIVLLADIITGFLEDPLWLLTALNISPKLIPDPVAAFLGLPLTNDHFLNRAAMLLESFRPGINTDLFVQGFDKMFAELMEKFIISNSLASTSTLHQVTFEKHRRIIKEEFMKKTIFPYNNLLISQGHKIKNEIVIPLFEKLQRAHQCDVLTQLTDQECLRLAAEEGVISRDCYQQFRPKLDYMEEIEPEMSFRAFRRKCNEVQTS